MLRSKCRRARIKEMLNKQKRRRKRRIKLMDRHSREESEDDKRAPFINEERKDFEPIQVLKEIISPTCTIHSFFSEYWEKSPLVIHRERNDQLTNNIKSLFSLEEFFDLVASEKLYYNQHVQCCRYVNGNRTNFAVNGGRVKQDDIKWLWNRKKATIQFHQPQHFKDNIWQLLTHLETSFNCLVGANVYLTPSGSQGLAPHYDDVEVFILQLEGSKHWRLYKPPTELPNEYSVDLSQEDIGSPTHDFILNEGDMLYFPRGTVHQADTVLSDTHSTHITISTYQNHSWSNFLQCMLPLLSQLLEKVASADVRYRHGLPNGIQPFQKMNSQYCIDLIANVVKDIDDEMITETYQYFSLDFIRSRLPPFSANTQPQGATPTLDDRIKLTWPHYTYLHIYSGQKDECVIVYHSTSNDRKSHMVCNGPYQNETGATPPGIKFPIHYKTALCFIFSNESCDVCSLPLTDEERTHLVLAMWSEGSISDNF